MQKIGKIIGIIHQIKDNQYLHFVVNNNVKCNIGDIVGLFNPDETIVLGIISDIKIDYYLDNEKLFFISKAVDNEIQKLSEPKNMPRYGQFIMATILGHYEQISNGDLKEKLNKINKYTPYIFQEVYLIPFLKSLELYGLGPESVDKLNSLQNQTFCLGHLAFPDTNGNERINLNFGADLFKKHTLITGVTGSGKSRLAALIIKKLAKFGGHISILDPHNEYVDLLAENDGFKIYKFSQSISKNKEQYELNVKFNRISFFEKDLNANSLSKLLPSLTSQQEEKLYEIFEKLEAAPFDTKKFIDKLIDDLNDELKLKYSNKQNEIEKFHIESEKITKNHTEFINHYITGIKTLISSSRADSSHVITALITKINDLRLEKLIDNSIPNWLMESPHSVDILNIDFSTNEYIRRFINSIIHHFLRKQNSFNTRIIVIDEAHMLLNEDSITSKLVKQLLREARKFNLSLVFISQNSDDIPIELRSQFQNHFRFREISSHDSKYFPDQLCQVTLFGAKTCFSMRVDDIYRVSENKH